MRKLYLLIAVVSLGIFFVPIVRAQDKKTEPDKTERFFKKSPFRYVIVAGESELEKFVNSYPDGFDFQVLMDDKDFNEENLKILGALLMKRFKNPVLSFWVYTSLEAIKTPEEQDQSSLYGPIDDYFKYKRAYFFVNRKGETWFKYSIPGSVKEKMIVLQKASQKD